MFWEVLLNDRFHMVRRLIIVWIKVWIVKSSRNTQAAMKLPHAWHTRPVRERIRKLHLICLNAPMGKRGFARMNDTFHSTTKCGSRGRGSVSCTKLSWCTAGVSSIFDGKPKILPACYLSFGEIQKQILEMYIFCGEELMMLSSWQVTPRERTIRVTQQFPDNHRWFCTAQNKVESCLTHSRVCFHFFFSGKVLAARPGRRRPRNGLTTCSRLIWRITNNW